MCLRKWNKLNPHLGREGKSHHHRDMLYSDEFSLSRPLSRLGVSWSITPFGTRKVIHVERLLISSCSLQVFRVRSGVGNMGITLLRLGIMLSWLLCEQLKVKSQYPFHLLF
jgi:hypothetical protein